MLLKLCRFYKTLPSYSINCNSNQPDFHILPLPMSNMEIFNINPHTFPCRIGVFFSLPCTSNTLVFIYINIISNILLGEIKIYWIKFNNISPPLNMLQYFFAMMCVFVLCVLLRCQWCYCDIRKYCFDYLQYNKQYSTTCSGINKPEIRHNDNRFHLLWGLTFGGISHNIRALINSVPSKCDSVPVSYPL